MSETVGSASSRLLSKKSEIYNPIEIQREVHKDFEREFFKCMSEAEKIYDSDYYIVVLTKKERILENVLRNFFFSRKSCPTPEYDQAVYKIHKEKNQAIQFLWVLPSKDTCQLFIENALIIAPEERLLLHYILEDSSGNLLRYAKKLNNEQDNSAFLVE